MHWLDSNWVVVAILVLYIRSIEIHRGTGGRALERPADYCRESGGITHHHRIQRLSRPDDRRRPLAR